MNRSYPVLRLSAVLACLAVSIVLACVVREFLPEQDGTILQGRTDLGRSVALSCSLAARRNDLRTIEALFTGLVREKGDLLSAGYRAPDGRLPRAVRSASASPAFRARPCTPGGSASAIPPAPGVSNSTARCRPTFTRCLPI